MRNVRFGLLVMAMAILCAAFAPATAQREILVPVVRIIENPVSLQADLYPNYYRSRSAAEDLRWVQSRSAGLLLFVQQSTDSTLRTLSRLSGLTWEETRLDLYLLRYFPTPGASNPLILPVGGTRSGALVEAAPTGVSQQYALIYLLARRLLDQADDQVTADVRGHYFWEKRTDRRDLLAHLLAYEAARMLISADSIEAVIETPYWQHHIASYSFLTQSLIGHWELSPERPLITWLSDRTATLDMPDTTTSDSTTGPSPVTSNPNSMSSHGQLGLSIGVSGSRMVIEGLDRNKSAYRCGLRVGDIIESVGGVRPENQRELLERILLRFDSPGATVRVTRKGKLQTIVLKPVN